MLDSASDAGETPGTGGGRDPSSDALLRHVHEAAEALGLDPARVVPGARLVDDLELDSLDWVDLAQRLEEALPVHVREERLASLVTVADLLALLRARLDASARRDDGAP